MLGFNLLPKPWATCCLLMACHRSHPFTIIDQHLGRCRTPVLSCQLSRDSANIPRYHSVHHLHQCICLLFAMLSSANVPGVKPFFSRVRNKTPSPIPSQWLQVEQGTIPFLQIPSKSNSASLGLLLTSSVGIFNGCTAGLTFCISTSVCVFT